jgi:hypothetical protein
MGILLLRPHPVPTLEAWLAGLQTKVLKLFTAIPNPTNLKWLTLQAGEYDVSDEKPSSKNSRD